MGRNRVLRGSLLQGLVLILVAAPSALALLGDIDGDTFIDATDVQQVLEAVIGVRTLDAPETANADVDGDGIVTALDAQLIQQFVFGLITEFPPRLPQNSGPIAVSRDGLLVGVVNPDSDSVSFLDATTDALLAEVSVGREPAGVAFSRTGDRAFVTNSRDGTVSVVDTGSLTVSNTISVGVEPFGVVVPFRGDRAFVANMASGTVSAIDTETETVVATATVGIQPQAIASTRDSDTLFVTHLRGGLVSVIDVTTLGVSSVAVPEVPFNDLNALSPAGQSNRMKGIAIHPTQDRAWLPHILSNSGNFVETLFNTSVFPAVSVLDISGPAIVSGDQMTLFSGLSTTVSAPEAVAFSPDGTLGYVVSASSNDLTILDFATRQEVGLLRDVGDHPRGIAVTPDGLKAYVFNRLTPEVTVVDLSSETILTTVPVSTDPLPPNIANGRRLFLTSAPPEVSQDRFFGCEGCHFDGRDDGQVWFFTNGPRQTLSMAGGTLDTGLLHQNGDRANVQDFAATFTRLQNGTGLTPDQLDDLADFVNMGVRFLENPLLNADGSRTDAARRGRRVFHNVGCADCHSGAFLTDATGHTDSAAPVLHDVGIFAPGTGTQDEFDKTRDQDGVAAGTIRPAGSFESKFLNGIWASPPYLHDGRSATLADTLTTDNPADQHGVTSTLTAQELADLEAYLLEADIKNARIRIDYPADESRVSDLFEVSGPVLSDVVSVEVFVDGAGPIAAVVAAGRFTAVVPVGLVPAVPAGTLFDLTAIATTTAAEPGRDDVEVEANFGASADPAQSIVSASPAVIAADGVSTTTVTVEPRDGAGDLVGTGLTVSVQTDFGALGSVLDVGDGTYTAELTSVLSAADAMLTADDGGTTFSDTAVVTFAPGSVDANVSSVSVFPTTLEASGIAMATVTVVPSDVFGNGLGAGQSVSGSPSCGSLGGFVDQNDGVYLAMFTAPTSVGPACAVTVTVNAVVLATAPSVSLTVDVAAPDAADLGRITFAAPIGGISDVTGGAGSVESLATVVITNVDTSTTVTTTAAADGSFVLSIGLSAGDQISIRVDDIATNMGPAVVSVPIPPPAVASVSGVVQTPGGAGTSSPVASQLVELVVADYSDPCSLTFTVLGTLLTDVTAVDGSFEIVLPGGFMADLDLDPDLQALAIITGADGNADGRVDDPPFAVNLVNDLDTPVIVDEFTGDLPFLMCDLALPADLAGLCGISPVPPASHFSPVENLAIEDAMRAATDETDFTGFPFGDISFEIEDDVFFDLDGPKDALDQIAFDTFCAAAASPGAGTLPTVLQGQVTVPSSGGPVALAGESVCLATTTIGAGLGFSVVRCATTDVGGNFSMSITGTPPHSLIVVGDLTYDGSGNPGAFVSGGSLASVGAWTTDLSGALVGDELNIDVDLAGRTALSLTTIPMVPIANFNTAELDQLTTLCRTKLDAALTGGGLVLANQTLDQVAQDALDVCRLDVDVINLLASIADPEGNTCNVTVASGPFDADGITPISVSITPVDDLTNPLGPGRLVELSTSLGTVLSPAIDEGNDSYTGWLTAPTLAGTAQLSVNLEGSVCPSLPSPLEVVFTTDVTAPSAPNAADIVFTNVGGATFTVIGLAGAAEPGSQVTVANTTLGTSVTVTAASDGSFRADLQGGQGNHIDFSAADLAGNASVTAGLLVDAGLTVPGIANPSPIPGGVTATVTELFAVDLSAPVPVGFTFVGGFDLDLEGSTATGPLQVLVGASAPVPADQDLVLAQVISVLEVPELRVVASAQSAGGLLFPLDGANFPGVLEEGEYAYLSADVAQSFVFGDVQGSLGALEGARVSLDTSPFVDLSRGDGTYLLAGPVGSTSVATAEAFSHVPGVSGAGVLLPFSGAEVPVALSISTRATRSFAFSGRFGSVGVIAEQVEIEPGGGRLWIPRSNIAEVRILETTNLTEDHSFNDSQATSGVSFTPNGFEAFIGYVSRVRDFTIGIQEPGILITTVGFPRAVSMTPNGEVALVASSLDNSNVDTDPDTLFLVDTFANVVEPVSIPIAADPSAVAVNATGTRAYVTSDTQNTLTVIDLSTGTVLETVTVGTAPIDVAVSPDDAEIYVANGGGASVTVLDAALAEDGLSANETLATVAVGGNPTALALTPDGFSLLVTEQLDDTMSVIDTGTLTVVEVFATVDLPADVTIHPDGTRAFVLDRQTLQGVLEVRLADADTTSPVVVDAGPNDRRLQLLQDSPLELVLNESVDPATVNLTNVAVVDAGDVPIAGSLVLSTNGVSIVFTPDPGVRYVLNSTAKVNVGAGLTDLAGNAVTPGQRTVPTFTMQLPDALKIAMNLSTSGVDVTGDPGAVEPSSVVTVTNQTSLAEFTVVAGVDGSFMLPVEGLDTDGFELVSSLFNGRAASDPIPVLPNFTITLPDANQVTYQPGLAGTLDAIGGPGAVDPQSSLVQVVNTTTGQTFATSTVQPDGSFAVGIFASQGDLLELVSTILSAIVLDPVPLASPAFAAPVLDFVTPERFTFGDPVTISVVGTELGGVAANVLLEIGGEVRNDFILDVLDGSVTQEVIQVDLVSGADSGGVKVSVGGQTSNVLVYFAEIPTNTSPFAEEIVSSLTAGDPNAALGSSDASFVDLGEGGEIVLRLGSTVRDGPGMDFQVFENTSDGEDCYDIEVSASSVGPFDSMGQFCGNAFVNLAGHDPIRFVRIVDAADGGNTASIGAVFAIRVEVSLGIFVDGVPVGSGGSGGAVSVSSPGADTATCVDGPTKAFSVTVSPPPAGGGGYGGGCSDSVSWSVSGGGSVSPSSGNSTTFTPGATGVNSTVKVTITRTGSGCSDAGTDSKTVKVAVVEVDKLAASEGDEFDDMDGNADTKTEVVPKEATGDVTMTATPKPVLAEAKLPACWTFTGGTAIGTGKLQRKVTKTVEAATDFKAKANTSEKTTKVVVAGVEFKEDTSQNYGFDNWTDMKCRTPVSLGCIVRKSLATTGFFFSNTDPVTADIKPTSDPEVVFFKSLAEGTVTVTPGQAASASQTLTLEGASTGVATVEARGAIDTGSKISELEAKVYDERSITVKVILVHEENDDYQMVDVGHGESDHTYITAGVDGTLDTTPAGDDDCNTPFCILASSIDTGVDGIANTTPTGDDVATLVPGRGKPNGECIGEGSNAFRDTAAGTGDDMISASNLKINSGADGVCNTAANNTDIISTAGASNAALAAFMNSVVYDQAIIKWDVTHQSFAVTTNFDRNRDGLIDVTGAFMSTIEMQAVRNAAKDDSYDRNVFIVDNPNDGSGGFCGFLQRYCFVHVDINVAAPSCIDTQITAHELGHSLNMSHVCEFSGPSPCGANADTTNLMHPACNSGSTKTKLRHGQWDTLNPGGL